VRHNSATESKTRGTSSTVIVDIVNGDLGQTELIENSLAAGAVSVDVACYTLIDVVVGDVGVQHGLDTGLETHFMVVDFASGLDEFGHAHAEDVGGLLLLTHGDV
jgi:hypothetical protein